MKSLMEISTEYFEWTVTLRSNNYDHVNMIAHTTIYGHCFEYDVDVGCDDCGDWFHEDCQLNKVTNKKDKSNEPWYCDDCSL